MARRTTLSAPYSQLKESLAQVMVANEFLESVTKNEEGKFPTLELELPKKKLTLKRVSKPGQRIYTGADDIQKVLNGFGISVISTSAGLMTGYQARHKNLGGEVLCEIS
jgi:small subunit ribosomal protein S8